METSFFEAVVLEASDEYIRLSITANDGRMKAATIKTSELFLCFDLKEWCASRYKYVRPEEGLECIIEITEACADRIGL